MPKSTKKREKYIAPIYGLKSGLRENLQLDKNLLLRNVDLLAKEYVRLKELGIKATCEVLLEINYQYDPNDSSEPYPGISLNILNMFDASLTVCGNGLVGVAAVFSVSRDSGFILSSASPRYEEFLDKDIDFNFVLYYKNFVKAYNMRPLAFDIFRRSQDRFANNDKTIDSCTVLESIFVPEGEKGKKSFILSGMKIMGFETNEINRIDNLVEYRNAIIHADREKILKLIGGATYTHVWFEETFKLIRQILYRYVEKPWN
jgi:hypothetical protein